MDLSHSVCKQMRPTVEETKINRIADKSPHEVGNKQSLGLVLDERSRIAHDSLIEIPSLKEEETKKEERPRHQLLKPELISQAAHPNDMQHHHAENTQSAQEVKGVIS